MTGGASPSGMSAVRRCVCRALDWFGWNVLAGFPAGFREPWLPVLRWGPYRWGMALVNRRWLRTYP